MPTGSPKPQTIASEKYQKKAGWMTKGFKIKRELADEFAEACETAGVSQASKISELMKAFIEEVNNGKQQRASGESWEFSLDSGSDYIKYGRLRGTSVSLFCTKN